MVSILINNAGVPGPIAPLIEIDVADWDEVVDVNVRGFFLMCKAFSPAMLSAVERSAAGSIGGAGRDGCAERLCFVVIDCEQGPAEVIEARRYIALAPTWRLLSRSRRVRRVWPDAAGPGRRAAGVIAPHIDSPAAAAALVESAHYPPVVVAVSPDAPALDERHDLGGHQRSVLRRHQPGHWRGHRAAPLASEFCGW